VPRPGLDAGRREMHLREIYFAARRSCGSAVGIPTGHGLDDLKDWSSIPCRPNSCHLSTLSRRALGPSQSLIQWVQGCLSPRLKQLVREQTWFDTSTGPTSS
jgi:hypothetical protein